MHDEGIGTTMRHSSHIAKPMRSRRRKSVDKFVTATLATAACVGLVGAIGIRTVDDTAAAAVENVPAADPVAGAPATTAQGLTEAQLDTYAAELKAEAAKLEAYRKQLATAAHKLKKAQAAGAAAAAAAASTPTYSVPSSNSASVSKPASKPVAKPVSKPAAKPASKPASSSKSS
jgi:hypothetical protein